VESNRSRENKELIHQMKQIHTESKGRYGAPKIHQTLIAKELKVSLKRVQRLMRRAGISSTIQKKYRPYTSKKEKIEERENLMEQDFSTTTINEKWVADITYIHVLREGWCYLASVLDLHSKKVIGYSFSRNITTDIVVEASESAYSTQRPSNELITL
jgi:putative transposase